MSQKRPASASQKKNRTLVMFSGGIDSTAALWYVLSRPKDYGQIHVHHVHIQNFEARWRAEAKAARAVIAYMRERTTTPFTVSESTINTPHLGGHFLYDTEVTSFISGYMTSRDPLITKVVLGATGTDFARGVSHAVARGKAIHNAFHPDARDHSAAIKEYPLKDLTKAEVYKMLSPELAALTWSCRRPRYIDGQPIECGTCGTCTLELSGLDRPKTPGKSISEQKSEA